MRPHALLALPLLFALTRAATIPDHIVPELEAKLSEAVKEALHDNPGTLKDDLADQALIDQVNAVEVVADESPSVDDRESDVADLRNPGPPQLQRHDAQNPEIVNEAKLKEASVSQSISETQNFLHEGFLKINENVQNPALDQHKLSEVKRNLNELQKNFNRYLFVLNEGVKLYTSPEPTSDLRTALGSELEPAVGLKKVETEFNSGIDKLSEGISTLRDGAASDGSGSTTAAPGFNLGQWWTDATSKLQEQVQTAMNNVAISIQNVINNNGTLSGPTSNQQKPPEQQSWNPAALFIQNIQNWFGSQVQGTTAAPQKEPTAASTEGSTPEKKPDSKEESASPESTGSTKSSVVQGIVGAMQKVQDSEATVEAAEDAAQPALKGHFGFGGPSRPGSEYSDDSDVIGLMNEDEAMKDENKIDTTISPILAEERKDENVVDSESLELTTKVESSMYKEEPTQESILEMTTKVEDMQKMEETDSNAEVSVVGRIKEESIATEDYKEEMLTTGSPLAKEITTMNNDLMLGDEPKQKEGTTIDTMFKEEYKTETTVLPMREVELRTEEAPVTEEIMEMFIRDGLLAENMANKDTVELEVSGTEASEIDMVTKKEELTTSNEYIKMEESQTTLQPSMNLESRNSEVETETEEVLKSVEMQTTLQPILDEQNDMLEVLPKDEQSQNDLIESDSTTEMPQAEENKKEQIKKEKHKGKSSESRDKKRNPKVIRRLIKRTLL